MGKGVGLAVKEGSTGRLAWEDTDMRKRDKRESTDVDWEYENKAGWDGMAGTVRSGV